MKKIILLLAVMAVIFASCEKEDFTKENLSILISLPTFENSEYNNDISKLAKVMSISLKTSKEFRQIVKKENLRKFDGDYNVLISQIVNYTLSDYIDTLRVQRAKRSTTIRELLQESFEMSSNIINEKKVKSSNHFIDFLLEKYPLLQIAIPVKIDEWDCSTTPVVTFIPSDFEEGVTKYVIGYTMDGDTIAVDAITPPDYPVIVISLNERVDEIDFLKISNDSPPAPTNLAGSSSTTGIHLTWNYSGIQSDQLSLERNDGNGYRVIALLTGNERDYLDVQNLVYGFTYSYRIKSINSNGNSSYSNAISISFIDKPLSPTNFEIVNYIPNQIFLSWKNSITNLSGTVIKIDRFIPGVSTDWENVTTLPVSESSFYDMNLTNCSYPYNRYQYRIYYDSGSRGKSDAVFDVEYNSLRASGEKLYIAKITIPNLNDIESWLQGSPDFLYTIATMNASNDTPIKLKDRQLYRPEDRKTVYDEGLIILGNWDKLFAQSVMSINLVEDDADGLSAKLNVSAAVKKAIKSKLAGDIRVGAGGEISMEFHTVDKNLGTEFVYYWENQ